jgi:hypothetical protein
MMDAPERIYLEPACCVSPMEGRQWCEDNVWPVDAASCEAMGIEYVRADLTRPLTGGVTPEMVEAGLRVIHEGCEPPGDAADLIKRIYLAMSNASRGNENG